MLYPLENEEQGINTRVFTWVFNFVMRVLECANKLLEILAHRTHRVWINKMAAEIMLNMIFNTHLKNKIGQ